MSDITIRNTTNAAIHLDDFGNQLVAATGDSNGDDIVTLENPEGIALRSSQMMALISDGDIIVRDEQGADITDPTRGWRYITGGLVTAHIDQTSEVGDKKLWVHSTPKPELDGKQFFATWAGASDHVTNGIGQGPKLKCVNVVGTAEQTLDFDFDLSSGDVYLHEAFISWYGPSGADIGEGNIFEAKIIASATQLQTAANLDYELDGDRVKYASGGSGTGTHGFAANPTLVPNRLCTGYWNYSVGTGLLPASGDGKFDIYQTEQIYMTLTQEFQLNPHPTYEFHFSSGDTTRFQPGYFVRVKTYNNSNTDWTLIMNVGLFREVTH